MMIAIDDIKGLPHTTSTFLFQKVFSPSKYALFSAICLEVFKFMMIAKGA